MYSLRSAGIQSKVQFSASAQSWQGYSQTQQRVTLDRVLGTPVGRIVSQRDSSPQCRAFETLICGVTQARFQCRVHTAHPREELLHLHVSWKNKRMASFLTRGVLPYVPPRERMRLELGKWLSGTMGSIPENTTCFCIFVFFDIRFQAE